MPDASRYTHGHHRSVLASHRWRSADNSAAYLLGDLHGGDALLDVGCGPGTISADLARLVAPGRVVAIDASPAVVEEARQRFESEGLSNAIAEVGDVLSLGFADGSFDVVHAHQVLQHIGDPVAALREMARVTRPGGLVAARDADYAAMTWFPENEALDAWLTLYRTVARANGAEPDAGRRLGSWALAAGLHEVTTTSSSWCFATPEERTWWGTTWAERMVSSSVAEQALAGGFATRAELEAIAAGWRTWAGAHDGFFAVLHGEIRARVGADASSAS